MLCVAGFALCLALWVLHVLYSFVYVVHFARWRWSNSMLRVLYINTSNVRIHVICLRFVIVVRRLFWQGRANLYSLGFQWVRRVLLGLRGAQLHMGMCVTCDMSGALYIARQGRARFWVSWCMLRATASSTSPSRGNQGWRFTARCKRLVELVSTRNSKPHMINYERRESWRRNVPKLCIHFGRFFDHGSESNRSFGLRLFPARVLIHMHVWMKPTCSRKSIVKRLG